MENSVSTKLINSISNFDLLSSSNAARVELVMKYCQKIDEILDPLKPVLDEVVSQISSDKKLNKVLEELDAATNEAKELIRSWHQMISKIYFVMQIESIVAKIQACSLDLCQLVHSLVPPPAANCTATCVEKLQQISCENISVIIREVSSELSRKVMSKSEILAKISNSLCLSTNLELLMEAVALDRIKMKGGSCEGRVELDNINHIAELIDYMHDNFVGKKQLHSIGGVPIPADFCCPLSLDLMSDPVIVASGQTYERVFIRKWLDLGYNVCPKTRQTLGHTNLIPNYTVKALIENWCEINDIEVADPMKLLSLRFPASLLCHSNGSASDKSPPCSESSPRANHPRSPESNHSGSLCENSCSSLGVHQDNTMQEKSTPVHPIPMVSSLQDANGSEANFSVVSLAASKAEKESQSGEKHVGPVALKQLKEGSEKVADVDQQLHSGSSSGSGIVAVSSRNNLQQLGEDSMVAQISGDSDASGEVTQESAASTASRGEAEFPPRLGEAGLRNLSIWRRSSDRTVPRIVLSPSMDSRTDVSGVETQVRKLIENMRSDSAETHKAASAELRLLARHNMENRIVIANCGAISTLVGLLHSADPKTQENAVTTLLNLSLNDNNKIAIANAEAIDPLIHVLQTGNAEAKENSAATLFSLSVLEENKVRIGRSGAIRPLVELLGHGTPRGKKDAATALFNLSIFHENKARIVHAGAVKHLVELMDPAAGMVDKAVAVLANLATIHEGRNAIAQAGGVPVLVEVVELGSARGRENAAAALLQLCTNSNRFCSLVLQEGAVPPLVALSQSGTPRAKEKAQGLLSYFRNQRHGSATRS